MLRTKPGKQRKCKVCPAMFVPRDMREQWCSFDCAVVLGLKRTAKKQATAARVERVKDQAKREELKPRQKWLKEAEAVINRYARLRDQRAGLGCISCDRGPNWDGQWHASHYKAVGANSALRFHLWNIHRGCSICNNHLSGNIAAYAKRLPAKIGQERFDWLETQNQSVKYEIDYLKRLKAVFAKKCRRMEKRIESL